MSVLEYHHIVDILREFDVSLPSDVVAALADKSRDLAAEAASNDVADANEPVLITEKAVRTRPHVNGEAQPCLRVLIHHHFMSKRGVKGAEAAAVASRETDEYLAGIVNAESAEMVLQDSLEPEETCFAAEERTPHSWYLDVGPAFGGVLYASAPHVIDEPGLQMTNLEDWKPLYTDPVLSGELSTLSSELKGLACAVELCQTYMDSGADNYQKRLAAFQCVKRIKEAIAEREAPAPVDEPVEAAARFQAWQEMTPMVLGGLSAREASRRAAQAKAAVDAMVAVAH
jgi:hypothetical protein